MKQIITGARIAVGAIAASSVLLLLCHTASAQQVLIDFRFDPSDTGYNPATPSTIRLTPGEQGLTYKIDIWGTVVPAVATPSNQLGLQTAAMRGVSDIVGGQTAFATGATIGTAASSFTAVAPFNASFVQPGVHDLGSSNNNGTSVTTMTADGISDFGGTIHAQLLNFTSNTGALIFGGGSTGQDNDNTTLDGWQWELGTFQFTAGTASSVAGKTAFTPLLLDATQQMTGSAVSYSVDGGQSTITGSFTVGSPVTFVVGNISTPEPSSLTLVGIGAIGLVVALRRKGAKTASRASAGRDLALKSSTLNY